MAWRPPDALIERARQLADGALTPAVPGHASTVVLLRDTPDGLEVHLQRRVATMAFGAGMHVFPGGRVDPSDYVSNIELPVGWAQLLGADEALARALVVAACRETFEEAGVLLVDKLPAGDLNAARTEPFAELGVDPSTELIRPWARWITPEFEPRRYDTRFFVAALPSDQQSAGDDAGGEADAAIWITPAEALARHRADELPMLPPTVFTIAEFAEFADTQAALTAAEHRGGTPVCPRLILDGDDVDFVIFPEG